MNKVFSLSLAGAAVIAVALTGCKGSSGVSASEASQRAHALKTSSQGQEAQQVGKDLAGTCLPAKDLNRKYLVGLAVDLSEAKALAVKCEIPKAEVLPFAKEVGSSVATLYLTGKFSTTAERTTWAEKTFPVIVKKYQGKK